MSPHDSARLVPPARGPAGLLEKLMVAVRPEFRVDVLVVDPTDPVLGKRVCAVPDCDRSAWQNGLCGGHGNRWRCRGRPGLAVFLANPGPLLQGHSEPGSCTVSGCHHGTSWRGLCMRHRDRWARAGAPDPVTWGGRCSHGGPAGPTRVPATVLHAVDQERPQPLLQMPHHPVAAAGQPRPRGAHRPLPAARAGRIDCRGLPPQLRLEFQYAVQCRRDAQTITAPPPVVVRTIGQAIDAGVGSLLAYFEPQWRARIGTRRSTFEALLIYARDVVETLRDGTG